MKGFHRTRPLARGISSRLKTGVAGALLTQLAFSPYTLAGPTGGNIVGGSGNIQQSNLTTTVNQNSQRMAIDWDTFNVNRNETVNFNQPNRSSIALNRILDINPSRIDGAIKPPTLFGITTGEKAKHV